MLNRVRLAAAAAVMVALACASAARADCKLIEIAEFHADVSSVGVPLLDGAINGTPIKVLIDSGSALSLVMRNSAERLHLASDRLPGQHVYGLGGQTDAYVATIKQLRVDKFTTSNLDLRIAGDRDAKLPWDVILGDDFLSKTDVEFDLADGFIRLFQSPGCEPAQLVYWGQPYSQVNLLPTNELAPAIIAPAQLNGQKVMAILDTG
jgi:predicted aspartyl protease